MKRISYAKAAALLEYDPDTGKMFWRESRGHVSAGQRAGTIQKHPTNSFWYVKVENVNYPLHHVAWLLMTKRWPSSMIGFKNGNGRDCRWVNLRLLTQSWKTLRAASPTKRSYKGVFLDARYGKWAARIKLHGRSKFLGYFETERAAVRARERAMPKSHEG